VEIDSSSISQVQQAQPQQQVADQRAFEQDLASQEQARQSVEPTSAAVESQNATSDYTNLIREARIQQAQVVQASATTNEIGQAEDAQSVAITAYQDNQENYEAPTSSGQLLPRVDAIV